MIETLREIMRTLMMALLIGASVYIGARMGGGQTTPSESQCRAACEEVKGRVVWNGNHWECLK